MALWFSSGAFQAKDVAGVLEQARSTGVEGIELSSGLACSEEELRLVRDAFRKGERRFLVHNYFPAPSTPFVLNIGALDEEGLNKSKALARTAIDIAHELQARSYSVHAGFAAKLKAEQLGKPQEQAQSMTPADINRDKTYKIMLDTARELADYAAARNVELLIENNVISPLFLKRMPVNPLLLTDAEEICRFFEDLRHPNAGLLLDVAHAKVSANALDFPPHEFVDRVAPYVRGLHLSDNDGQEDSNLPFGSEAWFVPRLGEFAHCEVVVEAYRLEPDVICRQMDFLQRFYS